MKVRFALVAALLALGACQTAQPAPARYQLHGLTDEFVAFYDRTEGMERPARIEAFKTEIAPLFPEFYGRERFDHLDDARYDSRIGRALDSFPAERAAYLAKAQSFAALLAPAYHSFERAFPDMGAIGDVYLLHSLGEMDGGTRTFNDRLYFVFGADVMGRVHPYDAEDPFFHHELFHVYHQRTFTGCEEAWCALWTEGLAVHVAHTLNPDATDAQLLLTVPEEIPSAVDANLTEAVCAVRSRVNSTTPEDIGALFSFNRLNERLPPRFGYYVGYMVAREAGRGHTIQELAQLDMAAARPVVESALAQLAQCEGL